MTTARSSRRLALLATGLYVLWGLMHLGLGAAMAISGYTESGLGEELHAESTTYFACVVVVGAMAIAIAVTLNRVNDRVGFWLNLGLVGAIDAVFVFGLVLPGHIDLVGGLSGPVVYLAAAVCSALARRGAVSRS